jgi:6-phosphogluconolactonase (cycloisomerase 2 family)
MRRPSAAPLLAALALAIPRASAAAYIVTVGFLGSSPLQLLSLDTLTGALSVIGNVSAGTATAWMVPSQDGRFLWVANHGAAGGVTTLRVTWPRSDTQPPVLALASFSPTDGPANPVHMAFADGVMYTVSYGDGSATAFTVDPTYGTLNRTVSRAPVGANAHQISLRPNALGGYTVVVPCLGDDAVSVTTAAGGCAGPAGTMCPATSAASRPGSGPRHAAFHPTLDLAYVLNELDSSVATYDFRVDEPFMGNPRYVSSLPPGTVGAGNKTMWGAAEVELSPDARVLYVSNRALQPGVVGNSNIGAFPVDPNTGELGQPLGWWDGDGDVNFPRHFSLTPDGRWLLVANQKGGSITVFAVSALDGRLTKVGTTPVAGVSPAYVGVLPRPAQPGPTASGVAGVALGLRAAVAATALAAVSLLLA